MPYKTWSEGYLIQAKQDFALVKAVIEWRNINASLQKACQDTFGASICMLLQMFFEKYSKACYCRWNHEQPPPKKHKSVRLLISYLKRANIAYYMMRPAHVGNLLRCYSIMEQLEDLQPANARGGGSEDTCPQLEYPWQMNSSLAGEYRICTPATDLPIAREIDDSSSRLLCVIVKFAERLLIDFDKLTEK